MKGTLKKFASQGNFKAKIPNQTQQKDPAEFEQELAEKVTFTTEGIKAPLHKFISSPTDAKLCVESFILIMSYMGDYPSKKSRDSIVQSLVSMAIKNATMYDEIICQIMKQLTANNSEKNFSTKRGWDLLSICLSCFPPTSVLLPTLVEFVNLHKNNPAYAFQLSAKETFERLERSKTRTEAFRLYPPSLAEILATETGTPMSVTIYFPGHITRTVRVDSFTTAGDVVSRVAGKVQMIEPDEFGLFIYPGNRITGSDGLHVMNKTLILDVLSQGDKLVKELKNQGVEVEGADHKKSKNKNKVLAGIVAEETQSSSSPFTLVCKKKIWKKDDQIFESDFLTNILFFQVLEDYLNGNLVSMTELCEEFTEVAAELTALQMKCATASYTSGSNSNAGGPADHFVLQRMIPPVIFNRKPEPWWRDRVTASFKALTEQPEIIFRRQVLKILQNMPLFGSTCFAVKNSTDPRLPNGAVICFNLDGIHVVDRITKLPVLSCGYNALIDYRYDSGDFVMNTGDLMNKSRLVLQTKEGVQICNTLDSYIEFLVKYTKKEDKQQLQLEASFRPSLKKYSPW